MKPVSTNCTITRYLIGAAMVVCTGAASASPTPQSALNVCQATVSASGIQRVTRELAAYRLCLQAMSGQVIKYQKSLVDAATSVGPYCAKQLRKVCDTRGIGKSTWEKFAAAVRLKCTPGLPATPFTINDITGKSPLLSQSLNTKNVDRWCAGAAYGDGSIDTVDEWLACTLATGDPGYGPDPIVPTILIQQYPRAMEWLAALDDFFGAQSPPSLDANYWADASGCTTSGAFFLYSPDIVDFSQVDFVTPIAPYSTHFPGTGEDNLVTVNKNDGNPNPVHVPTGLGGSGLRYRDNGDGTISDLNTGLMWEKKGNDGGLHDKNNTFPYDSGGSQDTIWDWLDDINAEGGTGFAGHNDWRIPNVKELQGIVNYGQIFPAVSSEFSTGCSAGCSAMSCSCTQSDRNYWSSSTYQGAPNSAWDLDFGGGFLGAGNRITYYYVRAVRGGL